MNPVSAGRTDTGMRRPNNEDSWMADDAARLYAVADGMGGHAGGEVASRMAIEALRQTIPSPGRERDFDFARLLASAFNRANREIIEVATSSGLIGMGTTMTTILMGESRAYIAHVGDSRAYLLRNGKLTQVTEDHNVAAEQVRAGSMTREEAKVSPFRHMLTRAIGIGMEVLVHYEIIEMREDDIFLLCSDGLTDMVSEARLGQILAMNKPEGAAAENLIAAANNNGGVDNITAVVIRLKA